MTTIEERIEHEKKKEARRALLVPERKPFNEILAEDTGEGFLPDYQLEVFSAFSPPELKDMKEMFKHGVMDAIYSHIAKIHKKRRNKIINNRNKLNGHYERRKQLGKDMLNTPFPGCEKHHINEKEIICMPAKQHRSIGHDVFTGYNMERINKLAFAWFKKETLKRIETKEETRVRRAARKRAREERVAKRRNEKIIRREEDKKFLQNLPSLKHDPSLGEIYRGENGVYQKL